jgi:hypothetical protein
MIIDSARPSICDRVAVIGTFLVNGEQCENDWTADDDEATAEGAYVSVIDLQPAGSANQR